MSPKTQLVIRSAAFGFIGGLGALDFFIYKFGTESWDLIFMQPIEVSLLFPFVSCIASAAIATRFDPVNFRWPQGIALAGSAFLLFSILNGLINAALIAIEVGGHWLIAMGFFVTLMGNIFFGAVLVGWIVFPLGALLGLIHQSRLNKSLNTDASDAGAG